MSIAGESPEGKPPEYPSDERIPKLPGGIEGIILWTDYAVQQAVIAQKTIESTVDSAIEATRSRIDRILTTSSAHFNQTIDSLQDLKSDYSTYEDIAFGKIKEGCLLAASHPLITTGTVLGVGFLGLKRTRQFVYYNTMRPFSVKRLEKKAMQAEEDVVRGRTKLRQAGKQIQSAINSAYKIERQARGLKDVLKELPSRESSRFRTQVNNVAKEAKKERNALSKEVTRISNHGISV
ncbi:UNVERIFIED_CONTAM: hypothetical protein Sradi_3253500 [Sesamum radiatum]|uniref:Uncharacterized protein n=1 Tax=Sesamum radiatum TaxID=300843 RepID=A0AAW2QZV8_SESRA